MKRAVAYARVSTDKSDQMNSIENQKQFFTDYIKQQDNWEFVGVYADEGVTGTSTKKRVAFNRMIEDAKEGKIDVIITKEVSRFARNTVDTLIFTRQLREHGVEVRFVNDNISTFDCDGELRLSLMASISQEESRKTSERVKWGQRRRMEQGVVFGNSEMLGFCIHGGNLIINEFEASIIRLIFHKYINEGKGTNAIARELDIAGIKPKKAEKWSGSMIAKVLRNEKYAGDLCQRKSVTTNFLTQKRVKNKEDLVYIENHHESIINRDLWERAQAELARRKPEGKENLRYTNRYWCSGLVWCGICGARYTSSSSRGRQSWRCSEACAKGSGACENRGINNEVLKECVKYVAGQLCVDKEDVLGQVLERATVLPDSIVEIKVVGEEQVFFIKHKVSGYKGNRKILVASA